MSNVPFLLLAFFLPFIIVPGQAAAEQIPVTTKPLQELAIFPTYSAPATVVSLNDARVGAEITGILTDLPVQVGDNVEAGALIARLDCRDYQFTAQQAQAMLKAARTEAEFARFQLERAQALIQTRAVSEESLNERQARAKKADADVDRLVAALKAAERNVNKCEIRAPFKATVIERRASVGELIAPGTIVARLLDREQLEVSGNIQEQDLKSLLSAGSINFVSGVRNYPLRVRVVLPFIESKIRSHEARFSFTEAKAAPGEAGRIEWIASKRYLPSELLVRRRDSLGVFIENGGQASFRAIPGAQEGQPAAVDLPADSAIIIDGRFRLQDGDGVRVTNH